MADSTVEPLLDTLPLSIPGVNPRRKRFRRCKSAPVEELVPEERNGTTGAKSIQRSGSFLDQIHPSFKNVMLYLLIYLGIATLCFYIVKDRIKGVKTDGVLDSVYFVVVTMTTVGYGDLVPNSAPTKLLACVFVFSGMAMGCLVLSKAADYLVEKQERLLIKALHMRQRVGATEIMKEFETNRVRYKCILTTAFLVVLVVVGTVFLARVEKLGVVDAFYCVCSTITTLGYGDRSFTTKGGRVFAIFWILLGTVCVAQFFLYIAEYNTENRQKDLVKWVLSRRMTNLDLEEADLDDDGSVGMAEFVIYKLKEMGKITQADISLVLEEFEALDVDQSGTLTSSDLTLAQS
ncbi:two-pore potassium channel 1 [Ipomoea triloba]|uniref:two-pore potassium channel 1 n=1 Tax=Ipomoea triloba TaxID=35885 RepID=UPI00125E1343|nr:two-pore potassium channel 1 [Ipomoea triloba]